MYKSCPHVLVGFEGGGGYKEDLIIKLTKYSDPIDLHLPIQLFLRLIYICTCLRSEFSCIFQYQLVLIFEKNRSYI